MREVPQYISQLSMGSMPKVQYSMAQAEATQKFSAQLGVLAEDTAKKSTEIQDLRTETAYKENLNRIYNENRGNPEGFNKAYDSFYGEFRGKLPETEFTQKLDIQHQLFSQSYRDKVMEQYSSNVEEDYKTEQSKTLLVNRAMRAELSKGLLSSVPETVKSSAEQLDILNKQDSEIYSSKDYMGRSRYSPEAQVRGMVDNAKTMFEALPARKRLEVLGDIGGGFASEQALVRKHEGGLNVNDGNTGNPAIFGINKLHHEAAFNEVKAIYDTNGTAAGQAAADAYLKKTFWDANGLDSLAPQVQGIVYDGLINGAPKELLERAKQGASPGELIDIRQKHYDKLEASGKYSKADVTSWNNRLNDYRHLEISDYEKYIDQDTRESLVKGARAEIEMQIKMEREDPPKAAMLNGARTPTDIAQPQLARGIPTPFVRVIDNESAQTLAQRVNQFQTTDDIVGFIGELQQQYGEFTPNAIRDLKEKGKMKPEMEGALSLAAMGRPAYKEHIDLLALTGTVGSESVNAQFTANGFKATDLNTVLAEETMDWQKAIENEGKGRETAEKLGVLSSLAKAKMSKTLDGDYTKAVQFAMKPENDMYVLRDIGKGIVRIPTEFDADSVEDGLDTAMSEKLPKMVAGSNDENYVYDGNISPFLSPTEDSIMFRAIGTGEPVTNSKGAVIEFKLKDLVGTRKPKPKIEPTRLDFWGVGP